MKLSTKKADLLGYILNDGRYFLLIRILVIYDIVTMISSLTFLEQIRFSIVLMSKSSLQAVLLHDGNRLPSVPVGHGADIKETYEN